MQELLSKYKEFIIVILINALVSYAMVKKFSPKPIPPQVTRESIDSLQRVNKILWENQFKIDAKIGHYEDMVDSVDSDIEAIENKIKNVGDKYNKINQKVNNAKNLQLDSLILNKIK